MSKLTDKIKRHNELAGVDLTVDFSDFDWRIERRKLDGFTPGNIGVTIAGDLDEVKTAIRSKKIRVKPIKHEEGNIRISAGDLDDVVKAVQKLRDKNIKFSIVE